jgi:hypothetical protein
MLLDTGAPTPMGGVKETTVVRCPRCSKHVLIAPGLILRIPANPNGDFCHQTADPKTGRSYVNG